LKASNRKNTRNEERSSSRDKAKDVSRQEDQRAAWNETYDAVDLDLCAPHPSVLGMRFKYESEALERSIRDNGQLEPCRAVRSEEDGVHLLVYIGQRRLNALRALRASQGSPSTLKVIIDEDDLKDEEIVKRALVENIDESGQRQPLSDLEKVSYCTDLLGKYGGHWIEKILIDAGFERNKTRKILSLVGKFDNEKIERLLKIEDRSNFRFRIEHLDLLLDCEDEENFYEAASLAAFTQKPPSEIRALRAAARRFSRDIPWFGELFPEFAVSQNDYHDDNDEEEEEKQIGNSTVKRKPTTQTDECDPDEGGRGGDKELLSHYGALPEPVILILCHHCKSVHTFKLRTGSPELVFCNLKKEGVLEQLAVGANEVSDCERVCPSCGKSFWVTVSILEGGKIVVETSKTKIVPVPKQEASVRKVYWDREGGGWILYDEVSKKKYNLDGSQVSETTKEMK
jgi:hypothetical protein